MSSKYNDVMHRKYVFALDVKYEQSTDTSKAFYGRDTFNSITEALLTRQHAYQVARLDTRRLYFDIDHAYVTDMEAFATDFVTRLTAFTGTEITKDDFQFHTKTTNGLYDSIHIIGRNHKASRADSRRIAEHMGTDTAVYSRLQQFSLCFCGKMGKTRRFDYHEINTTSYTLLWLDDPRECELIELPIIEEVVICGDVLNLLINNKKLMNSTVIWNKVMMTVKYKSLLSKEEFSRRSLTGRYTYEQNIVAWDNSGQSYTSLTDIYKDATGIKVTKGFTEEFFRTINATAEIRQYFSTHRTVYKIGNISYEDGILTYNGVSTFWDYDQHIHPPDFPVIDTLDIATDFMTNIEKFLVLKAFCGSGKTHLVIEPILNYFKTKRILIITCNNYLNSQYKNLGFLSHLDCPHDPRLLVCSMESIWKFTHLDFDLIVLDEYKSIERHFNSPTVRCSKMTFELIRRLCSNANKVVIADADLDGTFHLIHPNVPMVYYKKTIYSKYKFVLFLSKKVFENKYIADIKAGKKIVIVQNCYAGVIQVEVALSQLNVKILSITKDGVRLNCVQVDTKSLDELMLIHTPQVFIYSPSVVVGCSFNDPEYFDVIYAEKTHHSVSARQFIQMLFRVRQNKEKRINIFIRNSIFPARTLSIANDHLLRIKYSNNFATLFTKAKILDIEDDYGNIMADIRAEDYNSKTQFIFCFYSQMICHGLNVQIYNEIDNTQVLIDTDANVSREMMVRTPIPNRAELEEIIRNVYLKRPLTPIQSHQFGKMRILLNSRVSIELSGQYQAPLGEVSFNGIYNQQQFKSLAPNITAQEVDCIMNLHQCLHYLQNEPNIPTDGTKTENYVKYNFVKQFLQQDRIVTEDDIKVLNKWATEKITTIKSGEKEINKMLSLYYSKRREVQRNGIMIVTDCNFTRRVEPTIRWNKISLPQIIHRGTRVKPDAVLTKVTKSVKFVIKTVVGYLPPTDVLFADLLYSNIEKCDNTNLTKRQLKSKMINSNGVPLVNKYGTRDAIRLRKLYDKNEVLNQFKEYVINPSDGVKKLIQQRTEVNPPVFEVKECISNIVYNCISRVCGTDDFHPEQTVGLKDTPTKICITADKYFIPKQSDVVSILNLNIW